MNPIVNGTANITPISTPTNSIPSFSGRLL